MKYLTIFLSFLLFGGLSAFPDMKNYPHKMLKLENGIDSYLSKEIIYASWHKTNDGEYLQAYCPETGYYVMIFGLNYINGEWYADRPSALVGKLRHDNDYERSEDWLQTGRGKSAIHFLYFGKGRVGLSFHGQDNLVIIFQSYS